MPIELLKRRFDADEYQRMGRAGILTEDDRVELIDGEIITMTPIGPRHNAAVDRANRTLVGVVGNLAIVRVQGSVRLDVWSEPEPDLVLLRPVPDFYASRLPGPGDILLIIEIAESTVDYDTEVKASLYAAADVREYWLANLTTGTVTRFSAPSGGAYQRRQQHRAGESIAPDALPGCSILVDALLA
ncbi:MAG: Uma2 family endonuclease [Cyanobacteria bacterium]|nr:Uma2 family endonuclease [Cyanobacteriota bacterium]